MTAAAKAVIAKLCDELQAWCELHRIELASADEILCRPLITPEQRWWLLEYVKRWDRVTTGEIVLMHGPTGTAFRLDHYKGGRVLVCAPLLEAGGVEDNWGEVDFSRGLDEDQARECRAIEAALLVAEGDA